MYEDELKFYEPNVGEVAMFMDEEGQIEYKEWNGEEWSKIEHQANLNLNAYTINKQIYGQLPSLGEAELHEALELIRIFIDNKANKYYMMLNNETHYYTIFVVDSEHGQTFIEEEVINCASYLGQIKTIELKEDESAIEIWISHSDDTFVYYLFPYDLGVIECQ